MVPKLRYADMRDVAIKLSREEFVSDMVPKLRLANITDLPNMHRKEEFYQARCITV